MSFAGDMEKYLMGYAERIKQTMAESVKDVSEQIIISTPIDTGRARYNWIATLDAPEQSYTRLWGDDNADTRGDIVASLYGLRRYSAYEPSPASDAAIGLMEPVAESSPGSNFWLMNNLNYIRGLEYRASQQAWAMVRLARVNWQATVKDNIRSANI